MTSSERIGLLMFRYVRKELSAAEEKELTAWRNSRPDNESFFQTTTDPDNLWPGIRNMYDSKDIVYNQLREKLPGYFPAPTVTTIKKIPIVYRMMRYAASITVLVGFSLLAIFHQNPVLTEELLAGTNQAGVIFGKS